MKLGDILPHWIFRERAGVNLEVGSAFAHLEEDAGNSRLDIDWPLWIHPAADDASGVDIEPVGFVGLYPAAARAVFESSLSTDANPRFQVGHDGRLHWGDGATAPDTSLRRDFTDDFAKMVLDQMLVVGDYAANNVSIDSAGVVFVTDRFENNANGGSIVLKAPNGTRYAVTVSNAGAVVVAPA